MDDKHKLGAGPRWAKELHIRENLERLGAARKTVPGELWIFDIEGAQIQLHTAKTVAVAGYGSIA